MANLRISEKIKIRRRIPCGNQNEIFLAWVNSRGGIDTILFNARHSVSRSSGNAVQIGENPEDFATGTSFISMLKKDSVKELGLVFPNADKQTRVGLEELYSSPRVMMLLNGLNSEWDAIAGPSWQEVTVLDGRVDMGDSDEDIYDFLLRIELQPMQTLWR